MTTTPTTPLTNAEISHLETLLATPAFKKQAMGLDEIQGFLCAVISGPQHVSPVQWLPAVLGDPEARDKLAALGISATPGSAEQFAEEMKRDLAKYAPVVRAAGIKAE